MKRLAVVVILLAGFGTALAQETKIPDLADTKVTVPWTELKKLIEASIRADTAAVKPPVEYTLSNASYRGLVNGKTMTVTATADLDVLKEKWNVVNLFYGAYSGSGFALRSATLDNKRAGVYSDGGYYKMAVKGPGTHALKLVYSVKVEQGLPKSRASVPVLKAPGGVFVLEVPGNGAGKLSATADPSIATDETGVRAGILTVVVPETDRLAVTWEKYVAPEAKAKPIVYAEVSTLFTVGEGTLSGQTGVAYTILQSSVSEFQLAVPKGVKVLEVSGGDFKVEEKADRQVVTITPAQEASGSAWVGLSFEQSLGQTTATADLPEVEVLNVEREKGYIGVEARTNIEVKATKISGSVEGVDVKELPSTVWDRTVNPVLLAYKYIKHPYGAEIEIVKHEGLPVLAATIDEANFTTLFTDDGKMVTRGVYQVRNNLQQFVTLTLPESTEVWSTFVSGRPVKPTKGEKPGQVLVQLERSTPGQDNVKPFPVEVVYFTKGKKFDKDGKLDVFLPKSDIPTSELYWSCWLPDEYKYSDFKGNVKEYKAPPPPPPAPRGQVQTGGYEAEYGEALQGNVNAQRPLVEKSATTTTRITTTKELESNVQMTPQVQMEDQARQMFAQKGKAEGVFPVKVQIPERGKFYRFTKLLVTDEVPELVAKYKK